MEHGLTAHFAARCAPRSLGRSAALGHPAARLTDRFYPPASLERGNAPCRIARNGCIGPGDGGTGQPVSGNSDPHLDSKEVIETDHNDRPSDEARIETVTLQ